MSYKIGDIIIANTYGVDVLCEVMFVDPSTEINQPVLCKPVNDEEEEDHFAPIYYYDTIIDKELFEAYKEKYRYKKLFFWPFEGEIKLIEFKELYELVDELEQDLK